jgi:quercetin dioxygenase-like cupin family protein
MRLVSFRDDFLEREWCVKEHAGYVLKGEMKINFNGEVKCYKKGDAFWINKGEDSKHKVFIEEKKSIQLILFESPRINQ